MARLTPEELDEVVDGLLAQDTPARVVAIAESGLFVPMPASVPLQRHRVISSATSALDLVVPDDIGVVIEAWEQARATGAAQGTVHPAVVPSITVDMHFVDARHRHGAYLGFVVGDRSAGDAGHVVIAAALRPRYGVTHKNDLALLSYCDESILRMLGYAEEELVGRRSLEIVHPDDHARAIANWMDLIAHPGASRRVRLRHRRADGSYLWLEITNTNHLNDPDRGYVLGETVDISEEMAEAVLGRPLSVGATLDDVLRLDGATRRRLDPAIEAVLRDGTDGDLEVPVETGEETRRVQVSLRALTGPDGTVTGAIVCLNDVTEAVRLREELLLRHVGACLLEHVGGDGFVGRLGGDEFLVVTTRPRDDAEAQLEAEAVAQVIGLPLLIDGVRLSARSSVGVARSQGEVGADMLVAAADALMYRTKTERRRVART